MSLNQRELLNRTLAAACLPFVPTLDLFPVREAIAEKLGEDDEDSETSIANSCSCMGGNPCYCAKVNMVSQAFRFRWSKVREFSREQLDFLFSQITGDGNDL